MELKDYFKNGKAIVWKEKFAIIKASKPLNDSFAVIKDNNEITVIINQSKIDDNSSEDMIKIEKDWKLITFDMELPFEVVGFLAKIAGALAEKSISVFVISSYSTDHILVKEKSLGKALEQLKELGFAMSSGSQ